MKRYCVALLLLAAACAVSAASAENLVIQTATSQHNFEIETVSTPQARADGLMYRTALPADGGMLFNFGKAETVAMWMKNTLIPLDILFIRADGVISSIEQRAVPRSLTPIAASEPVPAVLEINGGASARLGIQPGDRVLHPLFGAAK